MEHLGHTIHLETAALDGRRFDVHRVEGAESLNRLWRFRVAIWSPDGALGRAQRDELLDRPIALSIVHRGTEVRRFRGIVTDLEEAASADDDGSALELTIAPRPFQLTTSRKTEFFLERSIPMIVSEKLSASGLREGQDFVFALGDTYPMLEFVTQHAESDLDFISRLVEHVGIAFWFEERDHREVMVFSDRQEEFRPLLGGALQYGPRGRDQTVYALKRALQRRPDKAIVHDYNYRTPRVRLAATTKIQASAPGGEFVEYAPHGKTPDELSSFARIRAEELAWPHHVVTAKTNETRVRAGSRVHVVDQGGEDEELVVVEVAYRFDQGRAGAPPQAFNELRGIPSSVRYRPLRVTPKPRIPGLVHAVIDGAIKGLYAEIDEAGRYNVRFGFDRSGRTDLQASRPVRMIQPHTGARYGMHFPLRPGTEVFISFVEGDPDRPLIVGAIPNPETPSPVEARNLTENVLRSGSNNELVMEDLRGRERVRLHSPHSNTTLQMGSNQEAETGVLLKTSADMSLVAAGAITQVMNRGTSIMATSTALTAGNTVILTGIDALLGNASDDFKEVQKQSARVIEDTSKLTQYPSGGGGAARDPDGGPRGSYSSVGQDLSSESHAAASDGARAMAEHADAASRESAPRTQGRFVSPTDDPSLILGSRSSTTVFGRSTALVHADGTAGVSSGDTTRIIGAKKVDIHSPEEVEIAGRRSVHVTSSNLVDVRSKQLSVFVIDDVEQRDEALPASVSVAVLGEHEVRVKSADSRVVACAKTDFVIHAHEGDVQIVAKKTIKANASTIRATAGGVAVESGDCTVDTKTMTVTASGAVKVDADTVTITASTIKLVGDIILDGNVVVTGNLDVAGKLNA